MKSDVAKIEGMLKEGMEAFVAKGGQLRTGAFGVFVKDRLYSADGCNSCCVIGSYLVDKESSFRISTASYFERDAALLLGCSQSEVYMITLGFDSGNYNSENPYYKLGVDLNKYAKEMNYL